MKKFMYSLAIALILVAGGSTEVLAACTTPCVQFVNGESDTGSPNTTVSLGSSSTSGNMIVLFASCYYDGISGNCDTPWSVTDNKSNSYASVDSSGSGTFGRVQIFRAYNITGGASHTVTFTMSSVGHAQFTVVEFTNIITTDPNDVTNKSGYTAAASTYTSGTTNATTNANDLLVGITHWYNQATLATPGTSGSCTWEKVTEYGDPDLAADEHVVQYCAVTSTGNYGANGSFSPTPDFSYTSLMASFKMTGGGGGATVPKAMLLGVGEGW